MKKKIGVVNALFSTLDVIVGTEVKGKVNSFYFTPGEIKGICYSIGKTYKKGE